MPNYVVYDPSGAVTNMVTSYHRSVTITEIPPDNTLVTPGLPEGVPLKYCKVAAGSVEEMTTVEKEAIDQWEADLLKERTEARLKTEVIPKDYVANLAVTSAASGLVITTTISELQITDETTVEADTSLTKYVILSLIYSDADGFQIKAYEKTDGDYAPLDADEYLVQQDISEWYVVANGDTLVEVT